MEIISNIEQKTNKWQGPAILSYGYRPFFLIAAFMAFFSLIAWIFIYAGLFSLPNALDPISWHAHSYIFGYLWAILAGFLLTAIPNWTTRPPIIGCQLLILICLWFIGRFAIMLSLYIPYWLVIVLDVIFPVVLAIVSAKEIISSKNWHNLKILILVSLLIFANIIYDYQSLYNYYGANGLGARLGIGIAILMIAIIGGRIVPNFTRNWLVKNQQTRLPPQHNKIDNVAIAFTALSLLLWVIVPSHPITALFCFISAIANFYRLYRWCGWLTWKEPLVWVLHLAFLFIPLGFLAMSTELSHISTTTMALAQHFWMAGAIGLMTLAIMTRASLGHSGRPLHATKFVTSLYIALFLSVCLRFSSGFLIDNLALLHLSAALWIFAFGGFIIAYWKILTTPRLQS